MKFQVLDEKGIREIHESAVGILESIGMGIVNEEGRSALLEAGAREKNGRIVIGGELIEKASEFLQKPCAKCIKLRTVHVPAACRVYEKAGFALVKRVKEADSEGGAPDDVLL